MIPVRVSGQPKRTGRLSVALAMPGGGGRRNRGRPPSRNSNRVGSLKLDSGRVFRSFSSIPSKGSSFLFLDPLQALSPGVIGFLRALGVPTAIARTLIGAFGTRFSNWGHCPAFCAGDGKTPRICSRPSTSSSSHALHEACRMLGVPVPPPMRTPGSDPFRERHGGKRPLASPTKALKDRRYRADSRHNSCLVERTR